MPIRGSPWPIQGSSLFPIQRLQSLMVSDAAGLVADSGADPVGYIGAMCNHSPRSSPHLLILSVLYGLIQAPIYFGICLLLQIAPPLASGLLLPKKNRAPGLYSLNPKP